KPPMATDLAQRHEAVGNLLGDALERDPAEFRLSDEQVAHFHEFGYVSGIRVLSHEQVEQLREELALLVDPNHPGHELYYEYNSNEYADPSRVLFHAL